MAYVGATPWHGLGQRLESGASIDEWLAAAGMNFTVERSPVLFAHGMLKMDITTWGEKHVLYRDDTLAPLGVVSDSYQIVQPAQVLEFFRDLTAEAGFTLETAGVLFGGRRRPLVGLRWRGGASRPARHPGQTRAKFSRSLTNADR